MASSPAELRLPLLTLRTCQDFTPISYHAVKKILYKDARCLEQFFYTAEGWHGSRVYANENPGGMAANRYINRVGKDTASIAFPSRIPYCVRQRVRIGDVGVLVLACSADRSSPTSTQNFLWGRCHIVSIGKNHFIVHRVSSQ